MRQVFALATLATLLLPASAEEPTTFRQNPKEWRSQGGNGANWRYSPLTQITPQNAGKLQVATIVSTGGLRGHEGAPLVVDDVAYFTTPFPNGVFARRLTYNADKILWRYVPRQDPSILKKIGGDAVNRGLAYGDGKVFLSQLDTNLVAIDAKSGTVIWSRTNGDPQIGETSTSAPALLKDKVLVGLSGGDFGVRGHVTAYDAKTGQRLWRGYSTGPDADTLIDPEKTTHLGNPVGKEASLASWQGEQWKIGGGAPWGAFSYDADLNLVYYGTGNPAPRNAKQRPGDNRWTSTIFARDLDTGTVRWVYQVTPHDQWDYDATSEMILIDLDIDGAARKALAHFDKNGFAYFLDRATGDLLSADRFGAHVNWASKIELDKNSPFYGRPLLVDEYTPEIRGEDVNTKSICPSFLGAKGPQPAAYSPNEKLFYLPLTTKCMDNEPYAVRYEPGKHYLGVTTEEYEEFSVTKASDRRAWGGGALVAFDPTSKAVRWSLPERHPLRSGALVTATGVVFYGTMEGYLKAVDGKTGKELWSFHTGSGIVGDVVSYEHGGKQFVAVLSGVGGLVGLELIDLKQGVMDGPIRSLPDYNALGGILTIFALPN
ncbi:PQQ-dependent dehydrogenase, methanol/ethanol family [Methylosinus sp. C49]|uniref:PQQ-dependent dehydrogenase, methanol/ethanol family n=1 Tax=Methylosinus sp. C49 TaxID=2699395 RepID=UPI00137B6440|nr:PQQ-dependent dehydrogenase, methanol/ethanol family [Methylosinus sp. C49]